MASRTLWVRLRAPFAAFRPLQAGVYRSSLPVIPYSAAWGLVLNLAAVETRLAGDETTGIDPQAPPLRLCLGVQRVPETSILYQQLHSYPVGNSSKEFKEKTFGAKYHIAPARREVLVGFECLVGVQSTEERLLERVERGLDGRLEEPRYGLPFAGDNNFLFDRIELLREPIAVRWYVPVRLGEASRPQSCRLAVAIDRDDSSRTRAVLCAPTVQPSVLPPEDAWQWTPREPTC